MCLLYIIVQCMCALSFYMHVTLINQIAPSYLPNKAYDTFKGHSLFGYPRIRCCLYLTKPGYPGTV